MSASLVDAQTRRDDRPVWPWLVGVAHRYSRWRIGRGLDGLLVDGLDVARAAVAEGPVVFACNHVCWWDGPVAMVLNDTLGVDARLVVLGATVDRLPFLARIGAVPLRSGGLAVRRLGRFLDRPGRAVWIYPQGRQRPAHLRPLGFERGAAFLAGRFGAALVPVSLHYVFGDGPVPTAVMHFGPPVAPGALEDAVAAGLDRLDTLDPGTLPAVLPAGRAGVDEGLGSRLLAWVTR